MVHGFKPSFIPKALLLTWFILDLLPVRAAPAVLDAGSILQQVQPVESPAPPSSGTGLKIEPEASEKLPPSAPFEVRVLKLSGNTLFNTAILRALVADAEGTSLTLPQLDEVAEKITSYYRSHGYPLDRAIIPAQTIQDGVVEIRVIEAHYGKISLDNSSPVNNDLLEQTYTPLLSGHPIAQKELDHTLLLFTDIPGTVTSATLKPGETAGTSDLLLEIIPGHAVTGNVVTDNYGNRYTGKLRAGGTLVINNPMHHGDYSSFNGATSGNGMNYGRITYESLLNGYGTRMGGSYSGLHYILGDTLASLDGHGTAQITSLWARHPFMRSQMANLYGQIQYDRKQLSDQLDQVSIHNDRHLKNWTASLNGDVRDTLWAGAANSWNISWTSGHVSIDNAAALSNDAASANTRGNFFKWNANYSRLQNLNASNALYLSASAQGANSNLDSSEKLIMGGPYTVRAYDMGAISGDAGYLLTVESRHNLDQYWHGQMQAVVFADSANVTVNKSTWVAGSNRATLTGVGVGINWYGEKQWSAKACLAARVGTSPELVGATSLTRAWVEAGKGF